MTAQNVNPKTGIRYGVIAADSLDMDLVHELQYGLQAVDETLENMKGELWDSVKAACRDYMCCEDSDAVADLAVSNIYYECDEPVHSGTYEGVRYRTGWLGGALHVWVLESPHKAHCALCSPCVPNAGGLNNRYEGGVEAYDVPPHWRAAE